MKRFLGLAFFVLVSCSTQEKAEIVLNGDASTNSSSMDSAYLRSAGSPKYYKLHEVLYTDTLASLAKRYDVSPHDIITLNHLTKPYYLEPGEVVKIPVHGDSARGLPSVAENGLATETSSTDEPNKNTIKILPSLPSEQLHDYDY